MRRNIICLMLAVAAAMPAAAQQYQSTHLQQAVERLTVDSTLLQQPGLHYFEVNGQPLVLRVNEKSVTEHIGIPLFNKTLRTVLPSPIYDFMEFATLNHKYHIYTDAQQQHTIKFERGSWEVLEQLSDTLPCTIENVEEKNYRVTWQRDGKDVVTVVFPISYELLASTTRREMERNFVRDLQAFAAEANTTEVVLPQLSVDSTLLAPTEANGIFVVEGNSYPIPAINDNRFVRRDREGDFRLLIDSRYPSESLANMLVSPAAPTTDTAIELNIATSTYDNQKLNISLHDFLTFCRKQGCVPYFGFEGIKKGNMAGTLLMANKASGYDHIVYIECPTNGFDNGMQMQAHVYLFTPSSNIKNLFADKSRDSKSIIIWK